MDGTHQDGGVDLRTERIERGLSMRQAAKACGIATHTYLRVEHGYPCQTSTAKKIADFFGIRTVDLVEQLEDEAA